MIVSAYMPCLDVFIYSNICSISDALVDIIEPEGLNGDDQIKAQDVQIEAIYLKKYDFIIN